MKNIRKRIKEYFPYEGIVFFDGLDDAILGIDDDSERIVYSVKKALKIIYKDTVAKISDLDADEKSSGITLSEKRKEMARKWFELNVRGCKGEKFPIWVDDEIIGS